MSIALAAEELVPLNLLRAGQKALVEVVLGASDLVQRLKEMGLRDGEEVLMIQPGSPCLIRLGDRRLGLRADDLGGVLVKPGDRR
jgi:ferrous iron transport protein A